jgi:uncharacterized UPF0160 family protein
MAKEFLTASENAAEIEEIKSSISVEDLLKLDSIVIHGDRFHLDDVAFVAEIIAARQENGVTSIPEILRISRNDVQKIIDELEDENKKFIIGDIGNGTFDHHDQLVVRFPINGGFEEDLSFIEKKRLEQPYTASSKLWLAIGSELIGEEFASRVDRDFFMPLDANDNFGSIKAENVFNGYQKLQNPLSLTISWLNGDPKDPVAQMSNFMKAVEFLVRTFRGMINTYKNLRKSYEENHVAELENSVGNNGIIVLDKYIPSMLFSAEKVHYIVEPATNPGWWQVATTDSEVYSIINRELLNNVNHKLYLDLQNYDKSVDSGEIQTQKVFFHKTGFLASFPKKEWAEMIAYESRMIYCYK